MLRASRWRELENTDRRRRRRDWPSARSPARAMTGSWGAVDEAAVGWACRSLLLS